MKRLSLREIAAQAVPVGDEDYKQLLELAEQQPCCTSVVVVSSEPGDYCLLPGNNALTRGYMLLGPGEVLFEHFAHTHHCMSRAVLTSDAGGSGRGGDGGHNCYARV